MLISKLQEYMRISGYSPRTIKSYTICAKQLYRHFNKPLNKISESEFKRFLDSLARKKYSPYTLNLYHATLKYTIKNIYNLPFAFHFPYAKRHKKLPIVLSRYEINRIISGIKNAKHRLLVALSYGAGLRVSEAINIRVKDIYLEELTIHLKQAKGGKDRITILPEKLKTDIQNLIAGKASQDFVFESERGGKLTTRTAQKVFENSLKKAGIKKSATFHSL